jgi:hypothetical protein
MRVSAIVVASHVVFVEQALRKAKKAEQQAAKMAKIQSKQEDGAGLEEQKPKKEKKQAEEGKKVEKK